MASPSPTARTSATSATSVTATLSNTSTYYLTATTTNRTSQIPSKPAQRHICPSPQPLPQPPPPHPSQPHLQPLFHRAIQLLLEQVESSLIDERAPYNVLRFSPPKDAQRKERKNHVCSNASFHPLAAYHPARVSAASALNTSIMATTPPTPRPPPHLVGLFCCCRLWVPLFLAVHFLENKKWKVEISMAKSAEH